MALFLYGDEDNLDLLNEDKEYVCLPKHDSTEQEEEEKEEEEEYTSFPSDGRSKVEEGDEEMDEEQQVLCEGSSEMCLELNLLMLLLLILITQCSKTPVYTIWNYIKITDAI